MELRIREVDEGAGAGVGPLDGFGWPLLVAKGPTSLVRSVSLSNWPLLVWKRKGLGLFLHGLLLCPDEAILFPCYLDSNYPIFIVSVCSFKMIRYNSFIIYDKVLPVKECIP